MKTNSIYTNLRLDAHNKKEKRKSKIKKDNSNSNEKQTVTSVLSNKQLENKQEEDIELSMQQIDQEERNPLHRACLDQQLEQIIRIITDIQKNIQDKLDVYLTQPDKFECKPILLCCIKSQTGLKNTRFECLDYLFKLNCNKIKEEINCQNPRTLWTCIHWCSYYGDDKSVELLIQNKINAFKPEYNGYYPIDLAGKNEHEKVVKILIEYSLQVLNNQQFEIDIKKYLDNPLYLSRIMYWAALYHYQIQDPILLNNIQCYFFLPISLFQNKCALHSACQGENEKFLHLVFKNFEQILNKTTFNQLELIYARNNRNQTLKDNSLFNFTDEELKIYKDKFKKYVLFVIKWEKNLIFKLLQLRKIDQNQIKTNLQSIYQIYVNTQDIFGNSALHIASIKAFTKGIVILLQNGAEMNLENNELFQAKDLTQHDEVTKIYQDKFKEMHDEAYIKQFNRYIVNIIRSLFKKDDYDSQTALRDADNFSNQRKLIQNDYQKEIEQIDQYSKQLFVPDFILRAKITKINKQTVNDCATFFDLLEQNNSELTRLNFYISLLQIAKFDIYIMKSQYKPGYYYIMLSHDESELETQADIMNLQIKLMDSYDLEDFKQEFQNLYEPFRSRQRQEIIEQHLIKIKDLNEQINSKIIKDYYRMHKSGGINKIREKWLLQDKWYFPAPINQFKQYLYEGEKLSFQAINTLRLYFGEKISFYFAWKSYLTCSLLILAIPGLIIQIYIFITNDYFPAILPFWVCYVCLWSTLQIELWKRKASEITTRWGCLDILENQEQREVRRGFKGYEEIYQVTGELTKHQKKSLTYSKQFLSILVVLFFLALCVLVFVSVNILSNKYQNQVVITTFLNIIQGVGIFILNLAYNYFVMFFADFENHKYQDDYDQSIIYKNSIFTFINSYLFVFYAAFVNNKSYYELFISLVPVLISKQVQYAGLKVLVPRYKYYYYEYKYFKKLSKNYLRQQSINQDNGYIDKIEKFYEILFKKRKQYFYTYKRAILKLNSKDNDNQVQLEQHIDADQVELNGLKLNFEITILFSYFLEGIIDLGYITLFAAAFPIGPAIAVIANILEIKMKLWTLLEVYKRPECQRSAGIGDWIDIISWMGVFSVFSNFAILYLNYKKETVQVIYGYFNNDQDTIIWLFFLTISIILLIKFLFQWLIPDKPEWVLNQIQKIQDSQHVGKGQREALKSFSGKLIDEQEKLLIAQKQFKSDIDIKNEKLIIEETQNQKLKEIQFRKEQQELKEKELLLNNQNSNLSQMQIIYNENNKQEIMKGILNHKFIEIEHYLLQKRIQQIEKVKYKYFILCQTCSEKEAILECQNCDECLCQECYIFYHDKTKTKLLHTVIFLKSLKKYQLNDFKDVQFLLLNKGQKQQLKQELIQQNNQINPIIQSSWQKLQSFGFTIQMSTSGYLSLISIFNFIIEEYKKCMNLEQLKIDMSILCNYKKNNDSYSFFLSENIQQFLNSTELNLEEKIWINRLIYFCCIINQTEFSQFFQLIKILQNGNFNKKIELIINILGLDGQPFIEEQLLEQLFYISCIQNLKKQQNTINDMIKSIYRIFDSNHKKTKKQKLVKEKTLKQKQINDEQIKLKTKEKVINRIINKVQAEKEFQDFFYSLLQCQ